MKKIIISFFVLSLLFINTNQAKASLVDDLLNQIENLKTEISILKGVQNPSVLGVEADTTPRIMYWWGKVNQHVDSNGVWQTDPDGKSGANLDKLTYCKKWFPNTTSVVDYQNETIDTWRSAGNTGASTSTKMSTKCVQGENSTPSITVLSPNGGDTYKVGNKMMVSWTSNNIPDNDNLGIVILNPKDEWDFVYINPTSGYFNGATSSNDGIETFIIPSKNSKGEVFPKYPGTKNYVVRVQSKVYDIDDSSDNTFTINSLATSTTTPSITVLWPNGLSDTGKQLQSFEAGEKVNVKWSTKNISANSQVVIDIPELKGTNAEDEEVSYNDGQEIINLDDVTPTGYYTIRVRLYDDEKVYDVSDYKIKIENENNEGNLVDLVSTINSVKVNDTGNVTIKATIKNQGNLATKDDFMNVFMVANGYNGQGSLKYDSNEVQVKEYISAGKSISISKNIQIDNNGKYSVRVCADHEGSDVNSVADIYESSDSNNCSLWFNFEVSSVVANTSSITILSPKSGDMFLKGKPIEIHLLEDLSLVKIGLVYPDFNPNIEQSDSNSVYWMSVYSNEGKNLIWDGSSFVNYDGSKNYYNAGTGNYKILAVRNINDCFKNKINSCVYDLSDTFTITSSTAPITDMGCSNGQVYSFTTGQLCPRINDGCLSGYKYSPITGKLCSISNSICSANVLTQKLKMGMSGDQIKSLQEILNSLGYFDDEINGEFGTTTLSAVKAFQLKNGLVADGVVGLYTRAFLNSQWKAKCASNQ